LKIKGGIGKSKLGFVTAFLISSRNKVEAPIRLYVDTGSSHTTISERDAERIGIDYPKLKRAPYPIKGIGGTVDGYLLSECMLVFRFSNCAHVEFLDNILVLRHNPKTKEEHLATWDIPSLLGCDILKNYSVRFTYKSVILEK